MESERIVQMKAQITALELLVGQLLALYLAGRLKPGTDAETLASIRTTELEADDLLNSLLQGVEQQVGVNAAGVEVQSVVTRVYSNASSQLDMVRQLLLQARK